MNATRRRDGRHGPDVVVRAASSARLHLAGPAAAQLAKYVAGTDAHPATPGRGWLLPARYGIDLPAASQVLRLFVVYARPDPPAGGHVRDATADPITTTTPGDPTP